MAADLGFAGFSSIVSEGAKALFEPMTRKISYVFKYQSYIDELKDQVKELRGINEMVQQHVNHATRQGEEIYQLVKDWRSRVESTEGVAKSIIDEEDGAKKSCFKGLCPNLLSRYKLSKRAANAAKDATILMGKGYKLKSDVSYHPPPESAVLRDGKDNEAFDSRKKVFQDVMEALKDDKLNIIGIYGMGGVGKTTLVKQVAKKVMEDKLFDKVVMAEVTQTPDHHKIQNKLAFDLGMKFGSDENKFERADRLRERLKKEKRVLIILDNIWTKLEFDKVGIPYGDVDEKDREDDRSRRTIILTSRSRDLLRIDINSQKNFPIDALPPKEALQLFKKIVGDSTKISAFQSIANEIVERCGGLPVALSTVANALKTKKLDFWKDALNQLRISDAREIHGMQANVYTSIKLSYDFLESEEAKSLFCLCGLYSEGHAIQVYDLLRYGVGWGLFENVYTLEEARSRVHRLIDNLKSSCLLLDGDAKDEVKMRDVIHVVAVSIAAEKRMFNIPNVADVEKKMEETIQKDPIAISLPRRDIQELPKRLQCPHLQLFLLITKGIAPVSMQISDLFFEGTEELKVLSLNRIPFSSLPSSLGRLINLQTLCLDGCGLKDIAIVGQLKKLEILSLRDSKIKQLPLEIGQLTRLQLLDLSNCRSLVVIAPNVISKFSRLKELYMGDSFSQWDKVKGGSNASLAELKGLSKLTTLEIQVRDAQILPQDLVFVELQRYRICIGEVLGVQRVDSETSRLVELRGLENVSSLLENYGMKMLLKKTEDINLDELKGVQNVVHELDDGEGFPRLKHLQVKLCSEILHIVGSVGRVRRKVFPLLESLSLIYLNNLETICDSQLTEDQSFSNLRIIKVRNCQKLKQLFSFSIAKNLLRLQKVEVASCNKLEMIFGPDSLGFNEIIADDDPAPKVILPSLEELNLRELRNIKKIWPDHNQGMYCCQNLTTVIVDGCDHMKYLFSYYMVNSLLQLQYLEISYCSSMEGIVDTTGWSERDEGKFIELNVFPKLHSMRLQWLRKLTSFANTGHIHSDLVVEFPSLLNLNIDGCSNMLRFISTSSPEDTNHSEMQPPPLFDEKVRLPRLEVLHIRSMDNLRKIWHHQLASESFSKLKNLHIQWCHNLMNIFPPLVRLPNLEVLHIRSMDNLKYLFSYSMVNSLLQLQHLKIFNCESMEGVVDTTGWLGRDDGKLIELKVFPKLLSLWLCRLSKLTSFANTGYIHSDLVVEFPSLQILEIRSCSSMSRFISTSSPEDTIHFEMQPPPLFDEKVQFPSLEALHISSMDKLRKIWHHQLASEAFSKLKELEISLCDKLMNIFPPLVGEEAKECILFKEMEYLGLDCLPSLTSFCLGNFALEFPSLEHVVVRQCPTMKIFSQGVVDAPKLKKVKLTKEEDGDDQGCWEGNLNDTIKKLFNEMNSKEKIEPTQAQ